MNAEYLTDQNMMTLVWLIIGIGTAIVGGLFASWLYQCYTNRTK
jgi:hypothetical protein